MKHTRSSRLWTLFLKEWIRIKRNPAALMAVGLIILMAFLVNIENKASKKAKQQENLPCVVAYNIEDSFISYLKARPESKQLQFVEIVPNLNEDIEHEYPPAVRCVIEIAPELALNGEAGRRIRFKMTGKDNPKLNTISRWVLANLAEIESGVKVRQSIHSMRDKAPAKTLGTIDLGSSGAKAMVGAMLVFSAQYFLCCALFISFTAHERERGILQATALTTVSANEMLFAKLFFHITLSLIASLIIIQTLTPLHFWWFPFNFLVMLSIILPSIGLFSIATIITSLNRTQTAASLVGFCYLMLMGVVFALAPKFIAFAWIKNFMFESHAIPVFNVLMNQSHRTAFADTMRHLGYLVWLIPLLFGCAMWLWNRHGWRNV